MEGLNGSFTQALDISPKLGRDKNMRWDGSGLPMGWHSVGVIPKFCESAGEQTKIAREVGSFLILKSKWTGRLRSLRWWMRRMGTLAADDNLDKANENDDCKLHQMEKGMLSHKHQALKADNLPSNKLTPRIISVL